MIINENQWESISNDKQRQVMLMRTHGGSHLGKTRIHQSQGQAVKRQILSTGAMLVTSLPDRNCSEMFWVTRTQVAYQGYSHLSWQLQSCNCQSLDSQLISAYVSFMLILGIWQAWRSHPSCRDDPNLRFDRHDLEVWDNQRHLVGSDHWCHCPPWSEVNGAMFRMPCSQERMS